MPDLPHIVLFNPDQWRGDVLGHVGNPAAVTPVLDNLVQTDTVSFTNAFCQNTVCTPSRCSFMTGLYPHTLGHRTMHHMLHLENGETNLLKVLRDNGYLVWWGGKNDLVPGQIGFDDHCDVKFKATDEDYRRWKVTRRDDSHWGDMSWRGEPGDPDFFSFFKGKLDKGDDEVYMDFDWEQTLGAVDFIRNYQGEQPLCIYMPLGYPHPPYCVEEPWYSQTDRGLLPPRITEPGTGKPSILQGIREGQNIGSYTEEQWNELRAVYYGMCTRTDAQLGRVVEALRQKGYYDDTALFFFSDHGDFTGDYGLVEKTQNTFEDCLSHVPFLFKPPREQEVKGKKCDELVELVDLTATIYDMTDINPGYDSFGKSLLPLARGETDTHRDAAFCEGGRLTGERQAMELQGSSVDNLGLYSPRQRLQTSDEHPWHTKAVMCRTKEYKYVRRHYESDELYDLKKDPGEVNNVIDDPAYTAVLGKLKDRMLSWYVETCDIVPRQEDRR